MYEDYTGGYENNFGLPTDERSAAIYVAVLLVTTALGLAVLKKSGFRAMVAVGPRG